jgi:hypothetical protein
MLSLRGVTIGAAVLLMSGATITGAVAQTATTDAPGRPLQLLRIIEAPARPEGSARPRVVAHNRIHAALHRAVAMRSLRRHTVVAEAKVEQSQPTIQDAAPPAAGMDDTETTAPATFAAADPAPTPSPPVMGPLTVGPQLVDVASQADVNALDMAADKTGSGSVNTAPANAAPAAPPTDQVAAKVAALSTPAAAVVSAAASKTDFFKTAAATPTTPTPQAARLAVGSPGWIAQVLAALAGAVAAGAIAWFLIGSAPRQSYG